MNKLINNIWIGACCICQMYSKEAIRCFFLFPSYPPFISSSDLPSFRNFPSSMAESYWISTVIATKTYVSLQGVGGSNFGLFGVMLLYVEKVKNKTLGNPYSYLVILKNFSSDDKTFRRKICAEPLLLYFFFSRTD